MRTRRGSAAIFAMIMVVSTAALVLVMISLAGGQRTKQTRLEIDRIVDNAFEGGLDVARDMGQRGVLKLPQTITPSVGPVSETLVITDAASGASLSLLGLSVLSAAPDMKVSATMVYNGKTYHREQVIGRGFPTTAWQYALFVDGGLSTTALSLTTGSAGLEGDVYMNGTVTMLLGSSHIKGDFTATGLIVALGLTVDGQQTANAATLTFPDTRDSDYNNGATVNINGTSTLTGYTFSAGDAAGYPLTYTNNNLTLNGTLTGNGAIYCGRDVTINGNLTVSAGSHVVIICAGNVTLTSAATNVQPYIYCGGTLTVPSAGGKKTFTSGIVTNNLTMSSNLQTSFDPFIRDNPVEAYKLRLPGVWP